MNNFFSKLKSHKKPIGVGIVVLVIGVGVLIWFLVKSKDDSTPTRTPTTRTPFPTPYPSPSPYPSPTPSPDPSPTWQPVQIGSLSDGGNRPNGSFEGDHDTCRTRCIEDIGCGGWTADNDGHCWLKNIGHGSTKWPVPEDMVYQVNNRGRAFR